MKSTRNPTSHKSLVAELEMYRLIFDSIHNGVLVTDADGFVTHFNKPYGQFLGMVPAEQIGKHCTEVLENTRMHIVARTGKAEINQAHQVRGQNMVVQRIPIRKDGRVIAVFGQVMFKDVKDVRALAQRLSLLQSKVELYEQELINLRATRYTFDSIVGSSRSIRRLKREAHNAADNTFGVLITGESGTGKELFAQAIHNASNRRIHPFVRINCAAIPRDLLESELFGYEGGAFTGARTKGKTGKFELAHQGTLFLDEIGDLPKEMQPKLLRVLEDREFERVGGTSVVRSEFRLIAATNQRLDQLMDSGRFRKDLFYRLNVIPLDIPPLRQRRDDIIPIAQHLLSQLTSEAALPAIQIDPQAQIILKNYAWPGNVRELLNVLERTLSGLSGHKIRSQDLPFYLRRHAEQHTVSPVSALREVLARAEKEAIVAALQKTGYNKVLSARLLGIHRTLLYKKMKRHGIALDPITRPRAVDDSPIDASAVNR